MAEQLKKQRYDKLVPNKPLPDALVAKRRPIYTRCQLAGMNDIGYTNRSFSVVTALSNCHSTMLIRDRCLRTIHRRGLDGCIELSIV